MAFIISGKEQTIAIYIMDNKHKVKILELIEYFFKIITVIVAHIINCFKGTQYLMGIQNLTIKKCIPLIPLLLGIRNMMYPPKDQRGDTVFDGDTLSDVTPGCQTYPNVEIW